MRRPLVVWTSPTASRRRAQAPLSNGVSCTQPPAASAVGETGRWAYIASLHTPPTGLTNVALHHARAWRNLFSNSMSPMTCGVRRRLSAGSAAIPPDWPKLEMPNRPDHVISFWACVPNLIILLTPKAQDEAILLELWCSGRWLRAQPNKHRGQS